MTAVELTDGDREVVGSLRVEQITNDNGSDSDNSLDMRGPLADLPVGRRVGVPPPGGGRGGGGDFIRGQSWALGVFFTFFQ